MRVVSRLLITVAGLLLLTLLAGIGGWLSRHQWVPTLINHQLDGITLSELRGMTLGRQNDQVRVHVEHLTLHSATGLAVDIEDVQLTGLGALLRKVNNDDPTAPTLARLRAARVVIHSPQALLPDSPTDPGGSTSPASSPSAVAPEKPIQSGTDTAGLSIDDTLRRLQEFPLGALDVEQLYWPGKFDGHLTLSIQNTPGQKLAGTIHSASCSSCAVHFALHNSADEPPDIQLQLIHSDNRVADIQANARRIDGKRDITGSDQWALEIEFDLDSQGMAPVFKQLGVSPHSTAVAPTTIDWNALIKSLRGQIALTLKGEAPDSVMGIADLSNITATLTAPRLTAELPETVTGVPLALAYIASEPLSARVATLSPLVVNSVQGKFSLQLTALSSPQIPLENGATPMLETHVTLTTEQAKPHIEFDGRYDLARMTPLLARPGWSAAAQKYDLKGLTGKQRFSGSAQLPSLKSLTGGQTSAVLEKVAVKLETVTPAKFQLSLPASDNPLDGLGWKALDMQLTIPQALAISAEKIPGRFMLEIPELAFTAVETSRKNGKQDQPAPELNGKITHGLCRELPVIDCALTLNTSLNTMDLADAATAVSKLKLDTSGTFKRDKASASVELVFTNFNLVAEQMTSGPVRITALELFTQSVSCKLSPERSECQIPELALSIAPLSVEENQLSGVIFLRDTLIDNTPGKTQGLRIQSGFRGDNLNVQALDQFRATIASDGQMTLRDGLLSGNSSVSSGPLKMESKWSHSLETGRGTLNLTLPHTEFSPDNALTRAIQGLPVDIVDGSVRAEVQLHWPDKGSDRALLVMKDTGLQINESFAVGVNTEVKLQQSEEHWVTESPAQVTIDTMDAGVAVNNLHFSLDLQPAGDLTLRDFAAELLEGALTSDALVWNLDGKERHSQLKFTGISLRALAREMESKNFAASGLLDASIPLVTDKQGVTVENGSVQSRPPGGRLRYYGAFSPAMLGSNPQLKLLAGALEDYNYRDINGTISYPLSGDLKLNLKLTGRSDAIDANRDLIINLNLENNIPTMLRSLQASRDLTDVLEKQVQ